MCIQIVDFGMRLKFSTTFQRSEVMYSIFSLEDLISKAQIPSRFITPFLLYCSRVLFIGSTLLKIRVPLSIYTRIALILAGPFMKANLVAFFIPCSSASFQEDVYCAIIMQKLSRRRSNEI